MNSRKKEIKNNSIPFIYGFVAILLVLMVIIYPLIANIFNSFQTDTKNISQVSAEFVGLKNYKSMLESGLLKISFKNSIIFTVSSVVFAVIIGFLLAALLNNIKKGRSFYRSILVLPWVISPVVTGYAWRWLLNDKTGYINILLKKIGIIEDNILWLAKPNTALIAVVVGNIWRLFPFCMIMFLAALQSVPKELEEAAEIDGANTLKKFIYIVIPQIKRVFTIVVLLGFIWNFNDYTLVQIMTKGGPLNSTMVMPVLIRNLAFMNFRIGTGSALAVVLAVMLMILSIIYIRVIRVEID